MFVYGLWLNMLQFVRDLFRVKGSLCNTDKTPSKLKKFDALIRVVGAHGPDGTQGQRGLCSGAVSN